MVEVFFTSHAINMRADFLLHYKITSLSTGADCIFAIFATVDGVGRLTPRDPLRNYLTRSGPVEFSKKCSFAKCKFGNCSSAGFPRRSASMWSSSFF